jgi:putative ABC transport system permease protein
MFFRLLFESFRRQRRRKLLAGVAILFGTTAVTAMLALATTIGDRIHRELAVYGANIVVYPQADLLDVKVGGVNLKPATGGAYLHESDLAKLRGVFWANNITGVSPELDGMLKATIYRPDEDDSASGRHSDPEFAEGEESARTTTGSAKATALEGRRPVSYQPGASPQEMNRRGFRGLKSRSISSATDRPGLQPLDLRRFVTWGDAPGWYRSGLQPSRNAEVCVFVCV